MATTETVRLGGRLLPVVPQKHARLRHHLSAQDFSSIMSGDYAEHAYRILCILIPALEAMPEYEWEGFNTQEDLDAYREGDRSRYDEENDPSPTSDEIVAAFETALNVSGAGRLGKLMRLINSAGAVASLDQRTPLSPASPGSTGESNSTSSGTTPPTSAPSAA